MLQKQAVSTGLLEVTNLLMKMEILKPFRLVGGTALAMQIGHRISIDIDLFSETENDFDAVTKKLVEEFGSACVPMHLLKSPFGRGAVFAINKIKVDILDWKTKFIRPEISAEGVRMAAPEDILAMKMNTFLCLPEFARYTKKDYTDISFLLDRFSLKNAIGFYKEKYPYGFSEERVVLEGIKYHELADKTIMPKMLIDISWQEVKKKLDKIIIDYYENED